MLPLVVWFQIRLGLQGLKTLAGRDLARTRFCRRTVRLYRRGWSDSNGRGNCELRVWAVCVVWRDGGGRAEVEA